MARVDETCVTGVPSLRHCNCQWLLGAMTKAARCGPCASLRDTLRVQGNRQLKEASRTLHVNLR